MPKTDTTGQHHSFEDLMRKYHEGIENLVYAAEVECGDMHDGACNKVGIGNVCPFRRPVRIRWSQQAEQAEEVCAICNLDAIRTAIGPQKIRTDVHR